MAVHRSPSGRPARRHATHRTAPAHAVAGRATAAATLGAVTTGAFTAILPALEAPTAEADAPLEARLASVSVPIVDVDPGGSRAALLPVKSASGKDAQLGQLDKAAALAHQIAELHASQERQRAEQARVDALIAKGGLDGWIAEALDIMDLPQSLAPSIKKIILKESNGNPNAINRWDANARRGTPSQGLMQTIPSTFRKFVHPSLANRSITDPVANITAGVRYMIAMWGMDTLQQGGRRSASGTYLGY